jgi:hypothetical protein
MSDNFRRTQRLYWQRLAGDLVDEMLESPERAKRFLDHPEPLTRIAAVDVLSQHWKSPAGLATVFERMAFEDGDLRVRGVALTAFALCYSYTDDTRVGRVLARIVRDEEQPARFRSAAYRGLFRLRGRILGLEGLCPPPPSSPRFPEEIDWPFVDSFLVESRTPSPVDPIKAALPDLSEGDVNAVRVYQQAVEALKRQDYQRCVELVNRTLVFRPDGAGAYRTRALAYIGLGKLDDAVADLSRAIELRPHSAMLLRERAKAYRLKGAIDLAEQDEQAAAAIDGDVNQKEI